MGVPTGGQNLGHAQGRISISTQDVTRAQQEVARASQQMTGAFGGLGGALRGVGAAFGLTFGAQTIGQIARFATEAANLATAYNRQRVAAVNLAGSQAKLNDLLNTYREASGGSVSQTEALANVTKLMAVGFADSAEELEKFTRVIRGISLAMGTSQDFVTQNLILELFTQRGARLDQLGLQYDKVKQRADELRAADSSLTQQMAYQQAVLEQAEKRFGALSDSVEGQKTEVEQLRDAWADLRLEIGQEIKPNVEESASALNDLLELINRVRNAHADLTNQAISRRALEEGRQDPFGPAFSRTSIGRSTPQAFGGGGAEVASLTERNEAIVEWHRETLAIERQAARDRLDATRQYEEQRTSTLREYGKTIAREAEDFARSRARAEADYAKSIADVREAASRRELRMAEDLARNIAQARADSAERLADMQEQLDRTLATRRADSAERIAEWEEDRSDAIAERRKQSTERLIDLEEQFTRERERAMRDSRERLHQAAGQFDAIAINREQRRFAREEEERKLAYREQISTEQEKLAEGVAQLEKAHRKRLEDERRSLDKSIRQAQEAYDRQVADEKEALDKRIRQANEAYALQLEDAREADALRLEDMAEDFAERKRREDEDRRTRLTRMAQDHADQLAEMARQHELRLEQISEQEQEARDLLNDEFQKELDDIGIRTDAYAEKVKGFEEAAIKAFDRVWEHWIGTMQGAVVPYAPGGSPTPIYPTPSTGPVGSAPSTMNYQTTMGNVSFTIVQQPGQNSQDLVNAIDRYMRTLGSPYQP